MKRLLIAGTASVASIIHHAPLLAQAASPVERPAATSDADAVIGEGDIVVTAQRRSERLQDVPVSVTVADGARLGRQGVTQLQDFSSRQPNLRIIGTPASDGLAIRGTGSGYNAGFEQSVATFVDGVYRGRSRATRIALFDIDRVEVLKGPQTTFFGANAIAGALNITSKRPTETLSANASALYSPSDGEYNLEAGISGPITDQLSMRVAGRAFGMTKGYVKASRSFDGPQGDDKQGRVSLNWTPTDRLTVYARLDGVHMDDKGANPFESFNCPPKDQPARALCAARLAQLGPFDSKIDYHSDASSTGLFHLNMYEGLVNARLNFDAFDLISSTAYYDHDLYFQNESTPLPGLSPNNTPGHIATFLAEKYKQFSHEVRLESTGDGPFHYMAGAYYEYGKLQSNTVIGLWIANLAAVIPSFVPPLTPIDVRWDFLQKTETLSGFGGVTYDLTDRLSASFSLRYSRVHKRAEGVNSFGTGSVSGPFGPIYSTPATFTPLPTAAIAALQAATATLPQNYADPSRTDDAWMPSVNLKYKIAPDVMAYASFSKGFKAGGFGAQSPDIFGPESVKSYEMGLKASLFDRKLFTSLTVFRSDYDDLQEATSITAPSGAIIILIRNAAASRAQGVEFSANLKAGRHLTLFTDLAYLDSKYIRFPGGPCDPIMQVTVPNCKQDLAGQQRPLASKWSGSAGAELALPMADDRSFRIAPLVYFTSSFSSQPARNSTSIQKGYAKVDLRLSYGPDNGRWDVAVLGKNLTDKTTASYRQYSGGTPGSVGALPDRPRSIAFQLSFKY